MNETVIFNQSDVHITTTLVKIGNISFPVNGIGSVFVSAPNTALLYACADIFGGVALLSLMSGGEGASFVFFAIAAMCWLSGHNRASTLVLRTASGDQQALQSKDAGYLNTVKSAIEMAVAQRG